MRLPSIRSVVRNSAYLVSSHGITTLLHLFYIVILARLLEPDLYGLLNYGVSWYLTFIALTYLGLDVVLSREIGRARDNAPALVGSTLALRGAAALFVSFLSVSIALVAEPDSGALGLILVLSIALFSRAIWLWCGSVFTAFENTRYILFLELGFRPIEILSVFIVLSFIAPKSVIAIACVHAALWTLQSAIAVVIITKRFTTLDFTQLARQSKRLLVEGIPGALYTLTVIWFMQSPTVLYRQIVGTGDSLGHFALALQIVGYLNIIPYLIGSVSLPVLSRSATRNDGNTRRAAIAVLTAIPLMGIALGLLGLWLAPPLTVMMFGEVYRPTGTILGEAVWLLMPISLAIGLQQVLFSVGRRQWPAAIGALTGIAAMAASYAPLTEAFAYRGALLAIGLGMTIWACGAIVALIRGGLLSARDQETA
ncbi:MAG: oligosaccharide flippase family protein [Dongiaceae bacterium]